LFSFIVDENGLDTSPAAPIKRPKIAPRDNPLDDDQIKIVWQATENLEDVRYRVIVRLLLLSGCRKSEITGLKWSQINGTTIRLLKTDRKAEVKPHNVFITDLMRAELALIKNNGTEHVFSEAETFGDDNTIRNSVVTPFEWCIHDLRHTLITGIVRTEIGDRLLGKLCAGKATDDDYDHYKYAKQMIEGWKKWSAHIQAIVA